MTTNTSTAIDVGADATAWIGCHLNELREILTTEGVLRLRGLGEAVREFDAITEAVTGAAPREYHGGATPRTRIDRNVYSSTDFPSEYAIDLHSEMAYSRTWPLYLAFCCAQPARSGGATPLASTVEIAERIPSALAERLRLLGIRYRRAFHPLLGTDWRSAYGVNDEAELLDAAARRGENVRIDGGVVTSSWTLPAYREGAGGVESWFNQMVAFNVRTLPSGVREDLLDVVGEDGFPKNTLLGDGTPFVESDISAVRDAVDATSTAVPWEAGDLTIVDNRRFAHGRQPYTGSREVRVCMTGEGSWA
ncbi:TauD/TfdA family dioxygenase [Rhodococcus fascians]|nr:TauD/TfdA family dioxygenase [Rhodococcus fascians]MBY4116363.1 TauD/TfdA family dioxygenase [Rhodococcus fascians]